MMSRVPRSMQGCFEARAHRKEGFAEPQLPELRPVEQGW